jgi:iron complex outermembrane receptor protein
MKSRLFRRLISSFLTASIACILIVGSVPFNTVFAQEKEIVLEDVVVTAQKREENMQDIGAAVTAIKAERLSDSNVTNVEDLQGIVPSLQLGESFGFAQIMVRGIGTDTPFAGGDPSVAMHVDGAAVGQTSAQLGTLFDIERIEVSRGPQGTLYGRNATGGSVNIITRKPTEEKTGYFRFTVGNYTLLQFDGAAGGPISDKFLGRIATRIVKRDGYGDNLFNGDDIDDAETFSIRGHLQWLISDNVDLLLTASYHMEDDKNYMPKFRAASYPDTTNPLLFPTPQGFPRASDPRDIYADALLQNERDQSSFTAELNWLISDRFNLKSITNYQDFEKIPQQDFDATSSPFYVQSEQFTTSQFSEELQLNYDGDRLFGLFGLYYYEEEIEADNRLLQNIPVPPCGPPSNDLLNYDIDALCFHFRGAVDVKSYAFFANFNYDITDNLALILGARYTKEDREGVTDRNFTPASPPRARTCHFLMRAAFLMFHRR